MIRASGDAELRQSWLWLGCAVLTLALGGMIWRLIPEPTALACSLEDPRPIGEEGPLLLSSPGRINRLENQLRPALETEIPVAGFWLYAIDPHDEPAKWAFAAQNVELKLAIDGPNLVGYYRSRYKIPNEANHQELSFRFKGSNQNDEFGWEAGERKGKIHLCLRPGQILEANWRILAGDSLAGLSEGTTSLLRQQN